MWDLSSPARDWNCIPWHSLEAQHLSRRTAGETPGEGNGNPLQYSCLGIPTDRGAWWAMVHGVAKSGTRLSDFTTKMCFAYMLHLLTPKCTHTQIPLHGLTCMNMCRYTGHLWRAFSRQKGDFGKPAHSLVDFFVTSSKLSHCATTESESLWIQPSGFTVLRLSIIPKI